MNRNELPDRAFATTNRLLRHHTAEVQDGAAHATVDIDKLALCLELVSTLPVQDQEAARAHLMDHVCAIAGKLDKAEASSLLDKIRQEQNILFFRASMSTVQEKPSIFGPANGTARFLFNALSGELFYSIDHNELSAAETAANIHKGLSSTRTDEAEVVLSLPLGNIKEGSIKLDDEQAKMLVEGHLLVNIHSAEYPLGEIRGQVLPIFPDGKSINTHTAEAAMETDLKSEVDPKPIVAELEEETEDEKTEAGQEDLAPSPLTDKRPQIEPGQGGGTSAGDPKKIPGQETQKPEAQQEPDDQTAERGNVEASEDDSTFGEILASVSRATNAIGERFLRRGKQNKAEQLTKPSPSDLAASIMASNAHLDSSSERATPLMEANLTDSSNAILKMELELLDSPEKLAAFATPTAAQQEARKNVILTATFQKVGDKVIKMDGDFTDPEVIKADKILPTIANSLFEDGKFLGMTAKIKEVINRGTTERIVLMMESEDEGSFTFGLWMDIMRDAEGAIREVMILDNFVPAEFLQDFAGFLSGLK
ncbi:CHRD domain-containing protein [Candidatus Pacearchaeota archaeon]|nr:CHRD domain-containing protein [Candidatus Pacearchaeota archaeon]